MDEDYKIITIDSSYNNFINSNLYDFYMNLDEPLRNVYKINIITILVDVPLTTPAFFSPLDPIYININDYNRLISKKEGNNIYYFDSLIVENLITSRMTIKNDYNTSDHIYHLNPLEPQLTRFNIRVFDKNNTIWLSYNNVLNSIGYKYNAGKF